jgi:hypothetical protein
MQNCPDTVSARMMLGMATSRWASSNTIIGALPPSSSPSRFRFGAAATEITFPVLVLPVKLMTGTCADLTRASALSCPPIRTLTTRPASPGVWEMISAIRALVCAVATGRLTIVAAPAANAGARERSTSATGEFHGAMIPATPAAWCTTTVSAPCSTCTARPVSMSASAASKRIAGPAMETSKRASGLILPFSRARISTSSWLLASNKSAIELSTLARRSRSKRHDDWSKTRVATLIARSASSAPALTYWPITVPVAGSMLSPRAPDSTQSPSIQWRASGCSGGEVKGVHRYLGRWSCIGRWRNWVPRGGPAWRDLLWAGLTNGTRSTAAGRSTATASAGAPAGSASSPSDMASL